MSEERDFFFQTLSDHHDAAVHQMDAGRKVERDRIRVATKRNAETILQYNERVKVLADELVGDQRHTLIHITEMLEVCAQSIIDATAE